MWGCVFLFSSSVQSVDLNEFEPDKKPAGLPAVRRPSGVLGWFQNLNFTMVSYNERGGRESLLYYNNCC